MNQDFAELIDQLSTEVGRLRAELTRLREENARLSHASTSPQGLFDELGDQEKHVLRHQVIEHIRKIDHLLGEQA